MLTCVGSDSFGSDTIKNYESNGVDCTYSSDCGHGSVAPIFVNEKGENCIVIVNGANDAVTKDHIQNAKEEI